MKRERTESVEQPRVCLSERYERGEIPRCEQSFDVLKRKEKKKKKEKK